MCVFLSQTHTHTHKQSSGPRPWCFSLLLLFLWCCFAFPVASLQELDALHCQDFSQHTYLPSQEPKWCHLPSSSSALRLQPGACLVGPPAHLSLLCSSRWKESRTGRAADSAGELSSYCVCLKSSFITLCLSSAALTSGVFVCVLWGIQLCTVRPGPGTSLWFVQLEILTSC